MKTNRFKKFNLLLSAVVLCTLSVSAQESISLHSITTERQSFGDGGYTLDGTQMVASRAKLLSSSNFGPDGTYEKSIVITDGYSESGDLESVGEGDEIDLFYFGIFDNANSSLNDFTQSELDALYQWSNSGGKLIIGAGSNGPGFEPDILNDLWGFDLALESPTNIIPTVDGASTLLFDGPFGVVTEAFQGGFSQGYFNATPEDVVVLADNGAGDPTVILDCTTLDMIVADGDAYTFLGQITQGDQISNQNDIFWANTIAFMDDLEDPPLIVQNGDMLSVGDYLSYQWFLDGTPLEGQNESSIVASDNGIYSVEVDMDCGCTKTDSFETISLSSGGLQETGQIHIYPNPTQNELFVTMSDEEINRLEVYDLSGRKVQGSVLKISTGARGVINTSQLVSGSYVVVLFNGNEMIGRRKFQKW